MSTKVNRPTLLTFLISILCLTSSFGAFAHAQYERSDPGRRSIVARSPEIIKIWFSEQLEPAYSNIIVTNGDGSSVTKEIARLDTENNKLLILKLPILTPGKYTVFYKVLSVDGHVVDSKFKFKVKPPKQAP